MTFTRLRMRDKPQLPSSESTGAGIVTRKEGPRTSILVHYGGLDLRCWGVSQDSPAPPDPGASLWKRAGLALLGATVLYAGGRHLSSPDEQRACEIFDAFVVKERGEALNPEERARCEQLEHARRLRDGSWAYAGRTRCIRQAKTFEDALRC